ncbi:MAG TPA: S9 family peptidase [Candidatus Limnocylindria bacterium]|nr:S9 family peptidase [Candidatus Limnocylindria bacterium]
MPRAPQPSDLYTLRVPIEVELSPDGRQICFALKEPNPDKDDYRTSLWLVPADGSAPPRRLTLGATEDRLPRWSPDGQTLAFLSNREHVLVKGGAAELGGQQELPREGRVQVWLLPMAGGEARQMTRLPQDVRDICWSPDGRRLCLVSGAERAARERRERAPGQPPERDAKLIDRLQYMLNGEGYIYEHPPKLWLADVGDGTLRRLTNGRGRDEQPAWSPDGSQIAFVSNRHRDADLTWRHDIYCVAVADGKVRRLSGGRGERSFSQPAWSPDGTWLAALGHRFTAKGSTRSDVWRFRADEAGEGENLTAETDLEAAAAMNSDLFGFAPTRPAWSGDGRAILFAAPSEGSYELWRVDVESRATDRLTRGEHYLSRSTAVALGDGRQRVAALRATATDAPDVVTLDVSPVAPPRDGLEPRRLTELMAEAWTDVERVAPVSRWHEVDGRRVQGWFYRAAERDGRPAPLVVQIHGGPATLYGWSLMWEWQCLVAAGMSVYACNPRGSEGYGQEFMSANFRNWGDGPMRDVLAGVDSLIADGLVDGDRLGVTGGSYGGYLTSWIVGHTDRFKAAVSARSVNDMTSEMLSGDIAGPAFGRYEYGVNPWEDPDLYRRHSPLAYAQDIRTPLLIQHAEKDLRTPITQGEELFTVLRSLRRPVRFLRVPEESHELTRSGKPHRRVENIERIRDWFAHFLVHGRQGLPPV